MIVSICDALLLLLDGEKMEQEAAELDEELRMWSRLGVESLYCTEALLDSRGGDTGNRLPDNISHNATCPAAFGMGGGPCDCGAGSGDRAEKIPGRKDSDAITKGGGQASSVAATVPPSTPRVERWAIECSNGQLWNPDAPVSKNPEGVARQAEWLNSAKAWVKLAPFRLLHLVELREGEVITTEEDIDAAWLAGGEQIAKQMEAEHPEGSVDRDYHAMIEDALSRANKVADARRRIAGGWQQRAEKAESELQSTRQQLAASEAETAEWKQSVQEWGRLADRFHTERDALTVERDDLLYAVSVLKAAEVEGGRKAIDKAVDKAAWQLRSRILATGMTEDGVVTEKATALDGQICLRVEIGPIPGVPDWPLGTRVAVRRKAEEGSQVLSLPADAQAVRTLAAEPEREG